MPPVIIAVAAAAASAAAGGAVLGALAAMAVSFIGSKLLIKNPKQPQMTSEAAGITSMSRSSTDSLKVVYGERRIAGTVVYIETSDDTNYNNGDSVYSKTNASLHMVLVMAGHEVESIGDIYLEDVKVELDDNGESTESLWKTGDTPAVRIKKFNGVNNLGQFADLRDDAENWTDNHKLEGLSGVYVRLIFNRDVFPNGIPNISAIVKGKKVYDPRTTLTEYSNNAALCVRDYLADPLYGRGATISEIDDTSFIAAANICDEVINLSPSGTEKRYSLNGIIDTEKKPADILTEMMTASAGVLSYTGGLYNFNAGAYVSPIAEIDAGWFAGGIEVQTKPSRKELFNAVKGVFTDPVKNYQPTDFAAVTNSTYETQDGGEREYRDLELPFTTSAQMAQRIAKIYLEQGRQNVSFTGTYNLRAFKLRIGDRVRVTLDDLGWENKVFHIESWELTNEAEIRMTLKEDASAVYDWNSGEATVLDLAPNTNLPNPLNISAPANLTLVSGNDNLYLNKDGTVMSRIKATWNESLDAFAERYEVQCKKNSDTDWQAVEFVSAVEGEEPHCYLFDVQDSESYDVRVRTITMLGVSSAWETSINHTVAGKSIPPSDVIDFSVQQGKGTVTFTWSEVTDADLSGYEIRYALENVNWENATSLTRKTKGTHVTSAAVPPGSWTFHIKAFDTSGNESVNTATYDADLLNDYDIIKTIEQAPLWAGTMVGCFRNPLTNQLVVQSQGVTADDDWDTFDMYNPNPVDLTTYETAEVDMLFDSSIRSFAEINFYLGANETSHANISTELSSKKQAGSYTAFQKHSIGELTARYFKFKLVHLPNNGGVAVFNNFKPVLDQQERTQKGSLAVSASGESVTFTNYYHITPHVMLSAEGVALKSPVYSNVTTTGFDIKLFNETGTAISGTVNWEAKGV